MVMKERVDKPIEPSFHFISFLFFLFFILLWCLLSVFLLDLPVCEFSELTLWLVYTWELIVGDVAVGVIMCGSYVGL